jgi:hypothetical protein
MISKVQMISPQVRFGSKFPTQKVLQAEKAMKKTVALKSFSNRFKDVFFEMFPYLDSRYRRLFFKV